jgi:hypothetical protein
MYMSTSSIKKVSAAAIAAVLGLTGISHAAQITLPYITNFSGTPDTNGDVYTNGALQGQAGGSGAGTLSGSDGWVNENGETNDTATVSIATGTVLMTTPSVATPGSWSDIYNSNLADHPAGLYGPGGSGPTGNSNGNGVPLNPATYGNKINVNYTMTINAGGGTATDGAPASGFGSRVLDQNDNLLAALFTAPPAGLPSTGPTAGEEDVYVQSGSGTLDTVTDTHLVGPAAGFTGVYSIDLDFQNKDFTVYLNGVSTPQSTDIPFGSTEQGAGLQIGGVAFSSDNNGALNSATFDFSVVPEPASIAMVGLGGLLLLAKRPKKNLV